MRGAVAGLASVRPGRGYDFAFPTKTLVSVSCGTPVIFAGVGPLSSLVAVEGLGWSVPWDANRVSAAMEEALSENKRLGPEVIEWLHANYSLESVASRAVAAIGEAVTRGRTRS
jgi:hypothetical protein